jgi:hypothetical protein
MNQGWHWISCRQLQGTGIRQNKTGHGAPLAASAHELHKTVFHSLLHGSGVSAWCQAWLPGVDGSLVLTCSEGLSPGSSTRMRLIKSRTLSLHRREYNKRGRISSSATSQSPGHDCIGQLHNHILHLQLTLRQSLLYPHSPVWRFFFMSARDMHNHNRPSILLSPPRPL